MFELPKDPLVGMASTTVPDYVSDAELIRISVMADAIKLFLRDELIFYMLCLFTKSKCLRKKAFTVASIPQGPPCF